MTTLISSNITAIKARITRLETLLTSLYEVYESGTTEIESYEFDNGGEGRQKTKYRNLQQLWSQIQSIETTIESLNRKLNGTGVVNLNLRRR